LTNIATPYLSTINKHVLRDFLLQTLEVNGFGNDIIFPSRVFEKWQITKLFHNLNSSPKIMSIPTMAIDPLGLLLRTGEFWARFTAWRPSVGFLSPTRKCH